jgi:SAM-dependent methyltransferase
MIAEFDDPKLAAVYGTVNAYDTGSQPDFYRGLADELGARTIVELGSGTGLITRDFAARGFSMIGVEPSPAMLDVARRSPNGELVTWIHGGAEAIGTPSADMAFMSGHVAQFFLTDEAWKSALDHLHAALRPGGTLTFESRNPFDRAWDEWTPAHAYTVIDAVAGEITTWTNAEDIHDDIVRYDNHYRFHATGEELVSHAALRFRSEAELRGSLHEAGFAVQTIYGDWDRRPATPTTRELIVEASRV